MNLIIVPLQRRCGNTHRCCDNILQVSRPKSFFMLETQNQNIPADQQATTPTRSQTKKINLADFMEKNYRCDMSMSEFARASGRSLSTFKRDFKQMSTLSPERWLTDRRLRAAYELLKRGRRVSDACFDVGFKNVSHFSAIFKKKFGHTPGQARKGV